MRINIIQVPYGSGYKEERQGNGPGRIIEEAVQNNSNPLVLAGNCNACLGTLGGIGPRETGVIWFDATVNSTHLKQR